jgi:hypothetical protein
MTAMQGRHAATLAVVVVLLCGAGLVVLQQRGAVPVGAASPTRVVDAAGNGTGVDPQPSTPTGPTGSSPTTVPAVTTVAPPSSTGTKGRGSTPGSTGVLPAPGARVSVLPTNPPSWSLDVNGLSLRMRIEPAQPRVGDNIKFVLESSTTTSDWCCMNFLYRGGTALLSPPPGLPAGPCPLAPAGTAQATYTPTVPGQFGFRFQASRADVCRPGFTFVTANLDATVSVNPASS